MIAVVAITNTSIGSHKCHFFLVAGIISSLNNVADYNTVLLLEALFEQQKDFKDLW